MLPSLPRMSSALQLELVKTAMYDLVCNRNNVRRLPNGVGNSSVFELCLILIDNRCTSLGMTSAEYVDSFRPLVETTNAWVGKTATHLRKVAKRASVYIPKNLRRAAADSIRVRLMKQEFKDTDLEEMPGSLFRKKGEYDMTLAGRVRRRHGIGLKEWLKRPEAGAELMEWPYFKPILRVISLAANVTCRSASASM